MLGRNISYLATPAAQSMNPPSPPSELIDAFREDRASIFVGAGASMAAGLPGWDELVTQLANELRITLPTGPLSPDTLLKIPQYYENRSGGRRELMRRLDKLLKSGRKNLRKLKAALRRPVHHYLVQLPNKLYYTTNFDTFLEDELAEQGIEFDVVDSENMARQRSERGGRQVRKIHGSIKGEWNDVVLTRSDYACVLQTHRMLFQALTEDLKSHVFLFIGFGLRDPDFGSIYNNVFLAMQGKHETHFLALLEDPGEYETEDLRRRGLVPVDVWNYPGGDKTQKLCAFLASLVEATSEEIHLRRFYQGLERDDHISIVITSRLHKEENYVYYPACDIHTANQIKEDLRKLGVTATILADEWALNKCDHLLSDNVVLVCSPFGNRFTKYVFEQAGTVESSIRERFVSSGDERCLEAADGQRFRSDNPKTIRSGERVEHALIARYRNPWANGKYIFVFAGIQALGTQAAGEFITSTNGYRQINEFANAEDVAVVLPVAYSEHDPFNPEFKIGELVRVST